MLSSPIGRLRIVGLVEGASFLILLFIAMPLKYFADTPEAVKVVGWIHGMLFIVYCVAIVLAMTDEVRLGWKLGVASFVAAVIPFGPFIIEPRLKRKHLAHAPA